MGRVTMEMNLGQRRLFLNSEITCSRAVDRKLEGTSWYTIADNENVIASDQI